MKLETLAFNMAKRMAEIDQFQTSDHNRYDCLWDAIMGEFSTAGMSLFDDEGNPIPPNQDITG